MADATSESIPTPAVSAAGFWQRGAAFILDCVLLGLLGAALGAFFVARLVDLGPWGRLIGFAIALLYFGLLNSALTNGQTPGKRLLKIRVVDRDGRALSVPKSFARFLPIGAPWFLNNAQLPSTVFLSPLACVFSVLIFGLALSLIYLFLFNRPSRRSLHDFLVGSYVVRADAAAPLYVGPVRSLHIAVCGFLIIASGAAPYFAMRYVDKEPFQGMLEVSRAIESQPGIRYVKANRGNSFSTSTSGGSQHRSFMNVTAYTADPGIDDEARARRLAQQSLAADPTISTVDVLQISLVYGYDIGIASYWRTKNFAHPPAMWTSNSSTQ